MIGMPYRTSDYAAESRLKPYDGAERFNNCAAMTDIGMVNCILYCIAEKIHCRKLNYSPIHCREGS